MKSACTITELLYVVIGNIVDENCSIAHAKLQAVLQLISRDNLLIPNCGLLIIDALLLPISMQ